MAETNWKNEMKGEMKITKIKDRKSKLIKKKLIVKEKHLLKRKKCQLNKIARNANIPIR